MHALLITPDNVQEFAEMIAQIVTDRLQAETNDRAPVYPAQDRFLKSGEACQELGISYPTLRKLIQTGYLTPVFNGTRTPRFRLSDLRTMNPDELRRVRRRRQ